MMSFPEPELDVPLFFISILYDISVGTSWMKIFPVESVKEEMAGSDKIKDEKSILER